MRNKLKLFLQSIVCALCIILPVEYYHWTKIISEPLDNWIKIEHINITPSVRLNETPVLIIDQKVGKDFRSKWIIEVQKVEQFNTSIACSNIIIDALYLKRDELTIPLNNVFGRDCVLLPGKYRVYLLIQINRDEIYPSAQIEKTSNIFEVLPY